MLQKASQPSVGDAKGRVNGSYAGTHNGSCAGTNNGSCAGADNGSYAGTDKVTKEVPRIDGPSDSSDQTVLQDRAIDEWRTMIERELLKEFGKIESVAEGKLEGWRKARRRGIRIDAEVLKEVDSIIERMMGESNSLWKLNQLVCRCGSSGKDSKETPSLAGVTLDT